MPAVHARRWLGVYAYNPSTGQAVPGCVYLRSSETDATRQQQFFGSCGVAPTNFVGLPTSVCLEKAGECSAVVLHCGACMCMPLCGPHPPSRPQAR